MQTEKSPKNIKKETKTISPNELKKEIPLTREGAEFVEQSREVIKNILDKKDPRMLCVVGPCSIHNEEEAYDYAKRLKKLDSEIKETHFLVMRAYFEKPRTTVGWKGLISDPELNEQKSYPEGLKKARKILVNLAEMEMPAATEFLNPIVANYISDCISWGAIGARTTESQIHREIGSGLPMPIGYKNGTNGDVDVAINSVKASLKPANFLGVNSDGNVAEIETNGNPYSHVILRGGKNGGKTVKNFDKESVAEVVKKLSAFCQRLKNAVVIDASHANSEKDFRKQPEVFKDISERFKEGLIAGAMIESNLGEGSQADALPNNKKEAKNFNRENNLEYGISVTDGCICWETTEKILKESHKILSKENLKK